MGLFLNYGFCKRQRVKVSIYSENGLNCLKRICSGGCNGLGDGSNDKNLCRRYLWLEINIEEHKYSIVNLISLVHNNALVLSFVHTCKVTWAWILSSRYSQPDQQGKHIWFAFLWMHRNQNHNAFLVPSHLPPSFPCLPLHGLIDHELHSRVEDEDEGGECSVPQRSHTLFGYDLWEGIWGERNPKTQWGVIRTWGKKQETFPNSWGVTCYKPNIPL